MAGQQPNLSDYVRRYAREHDIGKRTIQSYGQTCQRYENWIVAQLEELAGLPELAKHKDLSKTGCNRIRKNGSVPLSLSLNSDVLNTFLIDLDGANRSRHTIARYRRELLVLWRDAFEVGLVANAPRRIRAIKTPETLKDAWTPEEVIELLAACRTRKGRFRTTRIRRAAYFESIIRAGWDTSLRLGDLLDFRVDALGDRCDRLQNKTQDYVDVVFQPETLDAIDATFDTFTPKRVLVWPLWSDRKQFYKQMQRIVGEAGLKGSFQKLRRSGVTDVCRQGGPGHIQAGHKDSKTTDRWYLNKALAYADRPRPTPLRLVDRRGA